MQRITSFGNCDYQQVFGNFFQLEIKNDLLSQAGRFLYEKNLRKQSIIRTFDKNKKTI